jgi:hypothetical protein
MEWKSEFSARIIERATGQLVAAVVRPVDQSDKVLWSHWHGELARDADDAHWEWDRLIDLAFAVPDRFEVYVIECAGELQGLRMLEVSENEVEEYGVHALRLSTAPWNRPPDRRYHGVGSILVGVAILRSLELGHRGQVHCESLADAEEFHRRNGMIEFDGPSPEGLRRFRFIEAAAAAFLSLLRIDGLVP